MVERVGPYPLTVKGLAHPTGSRVEPTQEFLEVRVGIVGPRRGLRMVLYCEHRKFFVANAFHRSVVQIYVGNLQPGSARNSPVFTLHREAMVL